MSHILEVDAAERARALAGGGVYRGGYQVAGQPPVLVFDKPAETDAEARARLAQEVGRLQYELTKLRAELRMAYEGDTAAAAKFDGEPISVRVDNVPMVVALWDDGDPDSEPYVTSVWTGQGWLKDDHLSDDFKAAATKAALRQVELDSQP